MSLLFSSALLLISVLVNSQVVLVQALQQALHSVSIFSGAMAANQLVNLVLWNALVPRWTGYPVPRLLAQVTLVVFLSIAIGIIMVQVYAVPVTGVLTTSGIFIAIIGFALRNLISDVFTSIALGIERPFYLGDWIQIVDGTVGRVARNELAQHAAHHARGDRRNDG